MVARLRWLLLTHEGRVALAAVYCAASAISIVNYAVLKGPVFGVAHLAVCAFGLLWTRWCLRRSATTG